MLTQADRLFLLLLRIAMRGEQPDPTPFLGLKESVWQRIRHLARAHAVAGFVGDTILKLPKEALPPRQLYLKIFTEVEMTKEGNRRLLAGLKDLMTKLEEVELPFVLLKGLGVSQYYPKPELRAGGDLDLLYYSETDYLWANVFLMQEGYHLHVESEARRGHTAFSYRSTLVENHARAVFFDLKRHNAYFEQLVQAAIREGRLERVSLGEGVEVDTLPAELNALYIFIHIFFHWLHWGVGFRQYCDWLLYLEAHRPELDNSRFTEMAQQLDILYPMQLFAQAAIRYLGAAPELFPFPLLEEDDPHSEDILQDVLRGGNFGFGQRPEPASNVWVSNWRKLTFKARRSRRLYAITPHHASRIIWGSVLGHVMLHLRPRGW